jgi:hypothetical protein
MLILFSMKTRFLFSASRQHNHHCTLSVITMDLATIQDWTRMEQERHMAPYHLSAINAIAICLNGSETPHAAALMITKIYDSCVEQPLENSDSGRVQGFWVILCDAARIFGSAQSRLIDLVHEISTQPDVLATDGLLAKDTNGMIYWRDVPGLPYALSDDALCMCTRSAGIAAPS